MRICSDFIETNLSCFVPPPPPPPLLYLSRSLSLSTFIYSIYLPSVFIYRYDIYMPGLHACMSFSRSALSLSLSLSLFLSLSLYNYATRSPSILFLQLFKKAFISKYSIYLYSKLTFLQCQSRLIACRNSLQLDLFLILSHLLNFLLSQSVDHNLINLEK